MRRTLHPRGMDANVARVSRVYRWKLSTRARGRHSGTAGEGLQDFRSSCVPRPVDVSRNWVTTGDSVPFLANNSPLERSLDRLGNNLQDIPNKQLISGQKSLHKFCRYLQPIDCAELSSDRDSLPWNDRVGRHLLCPFGLRRLELRSSNCAVSPRKSAAEP